MRRDRERVVVAADRIERIAPLPESRAECGRRLLTLIVVCDDLDVPVPVVVAELSRRRGDTRIRAIGIAS
jgi:hypothetical protein